MIRFSLALILALATPAAAAPRLLHLSIAGGALAPSDPWVAAVNASSPTAWWRLGESSGTDAADEKGNFNGTYTNGVTLGQTGLFTGGLSDTAVNMEADNAEHVVFSTVGIPDKFTIAAWVKGTNTGVYQLIFANFEVIGNLNGFAMRTQITSGKLSTVTCDDSAAPACAEYVGTSNIWDGTSHFVAITYAKVGGWVTTSVYVDGSIEASHSDNGFVPIASAAPDTRIGVSQNGTRPLDADVDEVLWYSGTAMTEAQLDALYNAAGSPQ